MGPWYYYSVNTMSLVNFFPLIITVETVCPLLKHLTLLSPLPFFITLANNLTIYFMKEILRHLRGISSFSNKKKSTYISTCSISSLPVTVKKTFPSSYLRPMPLSVLKCLPLLLFQESTLLVLSSLCEMFSLTPNLIFFLQAFRYSIKKQN